jgi:hypothetical protein
MGEGVSEDPFDSSIDASWLGATPTAEDAYGNPIVDAGAGAAAAAAAGPPAGSNGSSTSEEPPASDAAEAGAGA